MTDRIQSFFRGIGSFLLISLLIGSLTYLRLAAPFDILAKWLSQSRDPRLALVTFSSALAAISLLLIRFGFEVFPLSKWIHSDKLRAYVAGLPIWFLILILFSTLLIFWQYSPTCVPPTGVQFEIGGTGRVYSPLSVLEMRAGQALTLIAKTPDENETLNCSWEYSGSAFGGIKNQVSGCQISLKFNPEGGEGVITVAVRQNFCTQISLFSLQVRVQP